MAGSYDFDPAKEDATVKIRVLPMRYIRINKKMHHCSREEVVNADTGRRTIEWVPGDLGEVWVPPRVADQLVSPQGRDSKAGILPIAVVVETKASERRQPAVK